MSKKATDVLKQTKIVPEQDRQKYKLDRKSLGTVPLFTDWFDPRYVSAGNVVMKGWSHYAQWLHCIGNWGEEHSMCQKMRWYLERSVPHEYYLEKMDQRKALGQYDHIIYYGNRPHREFFPLYKPVKKNRKGVYEFWQDRDFEPIWDMDMGNWKEHAPILHDIYVKGKKPIFDDE